MRAVPERVVRAPQDDTDRELDRELIERHRHGDPDAFEEIYRMHEEMVYNLCLRMTSHPGDAEDLVQETFLRVFRYLGGFRGGASLRTWIYRIAVNRTRSRYRRRKLLFFPLGETLQDEPIDPGRGPEDQVLARDASSRVERALLDLPLRFREAVVLRDMEGLAYQEIAEVLGLRVGTVRSRIARGRDRLRRALEDAR